MTYSDVLIMPVSERRFHLSMLVKQKEISESSIDTDVKEISSQKGKKTKKVSGDALKTLIKDKKI